MDRNIRKIIKKLAEEHNLSEFQVELIIKSQFQKTRDLIISDELKSVQLMHLGKFQLSEKRVSNYNKRKEDE